MAEHARKPVASPRTLSQLQPFNEVRFDAAIALLALRHDRPVSKYEAVKLHVLMDVYHTIETGMPVIGGHLQPWMNGPVVEEAYGRVDGWCIKFAYTGQPPEKFTIEARKNLRYLRPTFSPDPDDFSRSELAAMERAWNVLIPMMDKGYEGYLESQKFFHSETTFIGRAYKKAKEQGRDIDWNDIIDAYDALHRGNGDRRHIKALIQF